MSDRVMESEWTSDVCNQFHSEKDRPAIIWSDGSYSWYFHGFLHRENDRASNVWPCGTKMWLFLSAEHRDCCLPQKYWNEKHCSYSINDVEHNVLGWQDDVIRDYAVQGVVVDLV